MYKFNLIKDKRMIPFILLSFYILLKLFLQYGIEINYLILTIINFIINGILIITIYHLPRTNTMYRQRHHSFIIQLCLIFSMIYIFIYMLSGFIFSFGDSPYSQDFSALCVNILRSFITIFTYEYFRFLLLYNNKNKHNRILYYSIISIAFTILNINFNSLLTINTFKEFTIIFIQSLLPIIITQFFLTYLSSNAGWLPAFVYIFIVQTFFYFPPILPNLNWLVEGLVNFILPSCFFITLISITKYIDKKPSRQPYSKENFTGLVITLIFSILLIWFTSGLFPLYPSVIATGSMEPLIKPGDVIIIEKISKDNVKNLTEGDIIQFTSNNATICHRIIEVIEPVSKYRTKGDNNNVADSEILTVDHIQGIVRTHVPYIGWPTLLIKKRDPLNTENYTVISD